MSRLHCSSVCLDDFFFPQDYRPVNAMLWSCTGWKAPFLLSQIFIGITLVTKLSYLGMNSSQHHWVLETETPVWLSSLLSCLISGFYLFIVMYLQKESNLWFRVRCFSSLSEFRVRCFRNSLCIYLPLHVQIPSFLISYFTAISQCESSGISECV